MTDKSELEKAALAWRQAELDKRGEDFRYKPRTVDAAFRDGALWLLEQLFDYQREQQNYSIHFPGQAERMIGINDVIRKAKELCGK